MSSTQLTDREREYLACDVPLVTPGSAAGRVITGLLASILQAAFTPGSGKADQQLFRTVREIRYTKYKKAVLRKESGTPLQKDARTLKKLNSRDFVLTEDSYDPDAFKERIYEEYMNSHGDTKGPLS